MESALTIANLVGDIVAMAAAVISLIDTVLRHKHMRNSNARVRDIPALDDEDQVRRPDCGQPVRDDQQCPSTSAVASARWIAASDSS